MMHCLIKLKDVRHVTGVCVMVHSSCRHKIEVVTALCCALCLAYLPA